MKKIQPNNNIASKFLNGIVTKVNAIIDKLIVDVKVNGTSVVTVNEDGEREADIDLSLADQNVKQSPTTDNADYRILLSKSANDTEETDISRKNTNFKYNPSTGNLQVSKVNGNTVPSGSGTVAMLSDIPDELADLADDENHRLVTDSEKSAWDAKAETSDITSAINNLDVASTSIGAGETLATIKEENGKIAVTKQNIKVNIGQIDNVCLVGTNSSISGDTTWYKVASVELTNRNEDATFMLAVSDTYWGTDDLSNSGILYCRVRQGNPVGTMDYAKLIFTANSGLYASDFRLYYQITETGIIFEIWTSIVRQYNYRRFTLISQGKRTVAYSNSWTLYNQTSPTAAPTESSTYKRVECLDNTYKQTDNNILGAKNLLPYPYENSSMTLNGITFTDNGDGSITISGTATAATRFSFDNIADNDSLNYPLKGGYKYKGTCGVTPSANFYFFVRAFYTKNLINAESVVANFMEENTELDLTNYPNIYGFRSQIVIASGYSIPTPITFKPMIRLASIADDTWQPYAETNRQLTLNKVGWEMQNYLGAKNLLPYPYYYTVGANRGVNYEMQADGGVYLQGTNNSQSSNSYIYLVNSAWAEQMIFDRPVRVSWSGTGTGLEYITLNITKRTGSSGSRTNVLYLESDTEYILTPASNTRYDFEFSVTSLQSVDAYVYPMVRYADVIDDVYAPPAKSNRELSVDVISTLSQLATYESSNSASQAYAVGDYMVWKGKLYRVTTAIASGGTITNNTNVVTTTVGAELKRIVNLTWNYVSNSVTKTAWVNVCADSAIELQIYFDSTAVLGAYNYTNNIFIPVNTIPTSGTNTYSTFYFKTTSSNAYISFDLKREGGYVKMKLYEVYSNGSSYSGSGTVYFNCYYR